MSFYGMGNESAMIEDALEAGEIAWWLMELPSGAVFFSLNKIKILGYSKKDISKFVHFSSFTDLLHPRDYDKTMKAMQDHLEGKVEVYEAKYRIRSVSGKYIVLYDRGRIVARKGKEMAVAGIVVDVTRYSPNNA
jgi:PAS domain S-box-containing protein